MVSRDPQAVAQHVQNYIAEQQSQFQRQLDEGMQQMLLQQQQREEELRNEIEVRIESKYAAEFKKMKMQIDEQQIALEREKQAMMERTAALALMNFAPESSAARKRDSSSTVSKDKSQNGATLQKRFCAGGEKNRLTSFTVKPNNLVIEKNANTENELSEQSAQGPSDVQEMNEAFSTNDKTNNAAGGSWQTVVTKAQKNASKKMEKGKQRVTPIQLGKMETIELRNFGAKLMKDVGTENVVLQRLGGLQCPRIICETEESKAKVAQHLTVNGVEFNSFNNKESKRRAYIVRGMLGESDEEAIDMIENAVRAAGIDSDMVVSRFITPHQRFNPSANHSPLFKLVVAAAVDERLILGIRVIGYCGVKIEVMRKSGTVQCHNCQRLHRTTTQCNFKYRCVQCVNDHAWGNCPRANNKALPIGCVNCLDAKLDHSQHTANDLKNCNFVKLIENDKASRNEKRKNASTGSSSSSSSGSRPNSPPAASSTPIPNKRTTGKSTATSYASAVSMNSTGSMNGARGGEIDIEKIIAMTIRGVLEAIKNGI